MNHGYYQSFCNYIGGTNYWCASGRMLRISRPKLEFNASQGRSPVNTAALSLAASARQARSPNDKPSCRVVARSQAVSCAAGASRGKTYISNVANAC